MRDESKSFLFAGLVFLAVFSSVAIDSGIIPHFEAIAHFFGTESTSMLSTLTAFNGAFLGGLFFGSIYSGATRLVPIFRVTTLLLLLGGVLSSISGTMPSWLSSWLILGFGSGLLSHTTWEFTLNGKHSALVTARMISAQLAARPIGIALGVPLFALTSAFCGWKVSLFLFSLLTALTSMVLGQTTTLGAETAGISSQYDESLLKHYKSLSNPGLLYLILGNFFYVMSYLGLYGVLGLVLSKQYSYSSQEIAYVFGLLGVVEGGSSFISPILFKKFRMKSVTAVFSVLSFLAFATMLSSTLPSFSYNALLAVFVFSARQLIFASFRRGGEAVAKVAPGCPIGTFAIMAAWGGFSLSTLLLEKSMAVFGMLGCSSVLIVSYFGGLVFFSKFFRFNFEAQSAG